MENKFFLHEIKTKITDGNKVYEKGIVVHDTFEAAKQGYHAYLGAYAYGNNAQCDYVQCFITDIYGNVLNPFNETWIAPTVESEGTAET